MFGGLGCNLPKLFLFHLDNNSHAQANSGFRLLRSYTICLHLKEASHAIKIGRLSDLGPHRNPAAGSPTCVECAEG
jgi:hypothetical protein